MFERLFKFLFRFEKIIFLTVVLFFAFYFFSFRFFITGDGPAHLYNANLLLNFFDGADPLVSSYFELNSFPVPNWTGHLVLAFLNLFLATEAVEKVFLFMYFIGFIYSFKYLVQSFNPGIGLFALLILPFGMSLFLHCGFYNFCLSFIFLFLTIGFYVRHYQKMNYRKVIVLALFLLLLYFSHVTITLFAIFFLFLFLIWQIFLENDLLMRDKVKLILKNSLGLFLICLPALSLIFFYTRLHATETTFEFLETSVLVEMLVNLSPLVGHGSAEIFYTHIYLFIVIFLIGFFLIKKYWKEKSKFNLKKEDSFIIAAIILLIFYFILPDGDSKGGYISVRILYLFYLMIFIRVIVLDFPKWLKNDAVILISIVFYFHLTMKDEGQAVLSKWARMTVEAGEFIQPNSVVLPINCSSHWQAVHLPKYLGAKKPIVLLENYEAGHVYFPLKWKKELPFPITTSTHPDVICKDYFRHFDEMTNLPDYLFFYGFNEIEIPEECAKSDSTSYLFKYNSILKNDFCELYQFK